MVRSCGAAQVHFVAGLVTEEMGKAVLPKHVRTYCSFVKGFEWLIEDDDWFWFGFEVENRLLTVARKILAAAGRRVDIDAFYAGMGRSKRWVSPTDDSSRNYLIDAPASVVLQALKRTPWARSVQMNDFVSLESIDPRTVLSDVEYGIFTCIQEHHGVTSKFVIDQFVKENLQVTPMAVAGALAKSPIFSQPGFGLYAVRGIDIDPEALQAARQSVGGPARLTDINLGRLDAEGHYTWAFTLSEYAFTNRILNIPNALGRNLPAGLYVMKGWPEGTTLHKRENCKGMYFSRLVAILIAEGATSGDAIVLRISPSEMSIQLEIGAPTSVSDTVAVQSDQHEYVEG